MNIRVNPSFRPVRYPVFSLFLAARPILGTPCPWAVRLLTVNALPRYSLAPTCKVLTALH